MFVCCFIALPIKGEEVRSVHYAFANYLGGGFYTTGGEQQANIFNMPFSFDVKDEGKNTYGIRLPVSVGFFNFSLVDLPDLDLPDEIGTLSFTPGIFLRHQLEQDFALEFYLDFGFAANLTTNENVLVHSAGVSAISDYRIDDYDLILANRLYYAAYEGKFDADQDAYAAYQLGLDVGIPHWYALGNNYFQPRFFVSAHWYFKEVNFYEPVNDMQRFGSLDFQLGEISINSRFEAGITFKFRENLMYDWMGWDRIGISYQYADNISAIRLLFSMPI
ncbi:hypothetical protein [Thalassotalea agarivorans]|nr:hypothetical protein [Thalassotalea agarivorans]